MPIQDVTVTIDIKNPAPVIGLGRPLILAPSQTATSTYKEYTGLTALQADFATTTTVYKKAAAILSQKNKPDIVAVATYNDTDAGIHITDVFEQYFDKSWEFLLLADAVAADSLAISNALQAHDFKFLVLKVENEADIAQYNKNSRTIVYYHPGKPDEQIDGSIIGDAGSLTVGSITWKFRKNLVGITPVDINADDLAAITNAGANVYVEKAGTPQTSEGITATGDYIDTLHGQDWVKVNAESSLQNLLSENDKIPSNSTGVSMAASVLTSVLSTATQNGIVDSDDNGNGLFTVTALPFDQIPDVDREKRIYSGLSFEYSPEGAIHEMKVKGTIDA